MNNKEIIQNTPKSDIELASSYGFRFNVVRKEGKGKPWLAVFKDIASLSEAMEKVATINSWETGIFTTEGTLYWSSTSPEIFNSAVIERGKRVTIMLEDFHMTWDAFLKAKSKQKADKLLSQIKNKLGCSITITKNERYWKDNSLFQTIFSCNLNTNDITKATFRALHLNSKIAGKWEISCPCQHDDKWSFGGTTKDTTISGIELIGFHMHNFENKFVKGTDDAS